MNAKTQTVATLAAGFAVIAVVAFLVNHPLGRYFVAMVGGSIQYGHL